MRGGVRYSAGMPAVFCPLILLVWLASAQIAIAQEEEDESEVKAEKEVVVNAQARIRIVGPAQRLEPPRPDIDRLLFPGGSEQMARQPLEYQLRARTNEIDQLCQLNGDQRTKLQLAGRMQIKRLVDKAHEFRRKWAEVPQDPNLRQQFLRQVRALRMVMSREQFGDGSLFDKVVRKTLKAEQLPAYQQQIQARREFRRRAQRELLIQTLERKAPLTADQRDSFSNLLEQVSLVQDGQHEFYAFMLAASDIPVEEYQAILDETQWTALQALFQQAKRMEPVLRQFGLLEFNEAPEN